MVVNSSQPTYFIFPDLVSHCIQYPLNYHSNGEEIANQSIEWLISSCPDLSLEGRRAISNMEAGKLVAFTYPSATSSRLRIIADFMNYFSYFDIICDDIAAREADIKELCDVARKALGYIPTTPTEDNRAVVLNLGRIASDFWAPFITDAVPGVQQRLQTALEHYFEGIQIQAKSRDTSLSPDIESYITVRRNTSGHESCIALIEYALDIYLPDRVFEHDSIQELNRWTTNFVALSNDILSYNVEQASGSNHNIIDLLMEYHGHTLQSAVDYVGNLCIQSIADFERGRKHLPSWGAEIDAKVRKYVEGLQDWIIGSLHWSFQNDRYLGTDGDEVMRTGIVRLLPRKAHQEKGREETWSCMVNPRYS
ncbi:Germacradienol/germacrene D synthase [Termitomyces sp. T112]|nr:Germacradienol/germacrene D synthase [Termitomyces sp. T112]